ncbi:FecR family protein [Novosphingobium sp. PhB165]|uniref:FecR family protein n=1 Tax=Novosphingobium sp. PhB165 TaxID=2485105 RepID=UPI00104CC591|nr:FecR family protein [Novosphingobium sp. PhB165]TCM16482.1 FecR family protein [Novosphingobium sp. PhB165]
MRTSLSPRLPAGLTPDEAASYWLVQMDGGALDAPAQAEFDAWYAQNRSNAEAYARAREMWDVFDHAAGDPHLDALREFALAAGPEPRRSLWLGIGAGIAASLLVMAAFGALGTAIWRQPSVNLQGAPSATPPILATPGAEPRDYITAKGEQRRIALADGSTVTLNTDSALRVAFEPKRRLITLLRGEALFEVAKRPGRPFVVQAGRRQVTAVGTVFEVRLDTNRMQVTLAEGKVVVDGARGSASSGSRIVPTLLTPGHELVASDGAAPTLSKVDVEQQLRWRDGFVEFDDVPLSEALAEMNRYSATQLIANREGITGMRVSGIFRTGNPEHFAEILGEMLPLQSRELADGSIELVRKTPASR